MQSEYCGTLSCGRQQFLNLCLLAILGLLCLSMKSHAAEKPPILIGQSIALTGANYRIGQSIKSGAEAYINRVNAEGGIDGRQIRLLTLEDNNDAARFTKNINSLITEQGVAAIINCVGDVLCKIAATKAQAAHIPLVGLLSGAGMPKQSGSNYVFNIRPSYALEAEKLARQLATLGVSRLALVIEQGRAQEKIQTIQVAMTQQHIQTAIFELVGDVSRAMDTTLAALQAGNFNAAMLDLSPDTVEFLGSSGISGRPEWPPLIASLADPTLPGITAIFRGRLVGYANVVPNPETSMLRLAIDFRRDTERYSDLTSMNFNGMEAYIHARICIEALRKVYRGGGKESLAGVLDSFGKLELDGFPIVFRRNGGGASKWVEIGVISKRGYAVN